MASQIQADRETDAQVAEAMGYQWWKEDKGKYWLFYLWDFDPTRKYRDYRGIQVSSEEAWQHKGAWYTNSFPRFSTEIAAAFQMQEWIKGQGKGSGYAQALCGLLFPAQTSAFFSWEKEFGLIHASPLDRCQAFLKVVGDSKT